MWIYRLIMGLLAPLLLLHAWWRGEGLADLSQRLGRGGQPADLWLHGASLGELASARWLVMALMAARPGLTLVVTANTLTARQLVRDWAVPGVTARLAPLDLGFVLRAFLDRHRPRALISLEAEFWPLRFALCARLGIPVVLMGARMSERSFRRWQKRAGLARAMLGGIRLASTQEAGSRQRLLALGVPAGSMVADLDLKAQAAAQLPPPVTPARHDRAAWLLAASTHEGEEAVVLQAFARQSRFTHLVLAPRHPARGAEIVALLQGVDHDQRSLGPEPGRCAIYLADTLGEMDRWYATCGAVVIGGTFADKGGHTPWEPARFGTAILHGPSTQNFAARFVALDANGGALPVTADTLGAALQGLDAVTQDRMALAATQVLQADGDVSAYIARIRHICGI